MTPEEQRSDLIYTGVNSGAYVQVPYDESIVYTVAGKVLGIVHKIVVICEKSYGQIFAVFRSAPQVTDRIRTCCLGAEKRYYRDGERNTLLMAGWPKNLSEMGNAYGW